MKISKMFSVFVGLALIAAPGCFAQNKLQSRSGWKTYEAANGQKFEVNMDTIRRTQLGIMVWGLIPGEDIVAKSMIFDCHGHYLFFVNNNEVGTTSTGWMLAPPQSIVGRIAKDVCKNQSQPSASQYCADFSPEACNRIREAVKSKARPDYCKKDFRRVGSGLTEEQVRICSERAAKGIDPMPQ